MVKSESDVFVKGKSKVGIGLAWEKLILKKKKKFKQLLFGEYLFRQLVLLIFSKNKKRNIKMPAAKEIN